MFPPNHCVQSVGTPGRASGAAATTIGCTVTVAVTANPSVAATAVTATEGFLLHSLVLRLLVQLLFLVLAYASSGFAGDMGRS